MSDEILNWTICKSCLGRSTKRRKVKKKLKTQYKIACDIFDKSDKKGAAPIPPKGAKYPCETCKGSGLVLSHKPHIISTQKFPTIAIIGGGIGGVALAVACLHRNIPFTLYERDSSFNSRSQGYGLTLQQARKILKAFGILNLKEGVVSTRHVVHNTKGEIIGEWGMRKWIENHKGNTAKKSNIHIARQTLRLELIQQLGGHNAISWAHQLVALNETDTHVDLTFSVNGKEKQSKADLVIGADGIRSTVRRLLIGDHHYPLRYLGCIVILGICPLSTISHINSDLLDSKTVFQTANGNERIYMMPYDSKNIMWQLSFPLNETEAKALSKQGATYLKAEACKRTPWHTPIPEIIKATNASLISGYPVYDRALLKPELLEKFKHVSFIGDAAHPMSPFKGQGANQAMLDALALARAIVEGCTNTLYEETKDGVRKHILNPFERDMLSRSAVKVKDSAKAAKFLHTDTVLHKLDAPRGRIFKSDN